MELTKELAEQIAAKMRHDGFDTCTEEDVREVQEFGGVAEGSIGEDYDEKLTDRIRHELDTHGVA